MKYLWLTDPHLDHLGHPEAAIRFGEYLRKEYPSVDGLLVTGDIAEAWTVRDLLCDLRKYFDAPVYFVLGNHDYYGGSFLQVDQAMENLHVPELHWVRKDAPIELGNDVTLVGTGGWYDARYPGFPEQLIMSDFSLIADMKPGEHVPDVRINIARRRAEELAVELDNQLKKVETNRVVVMTHVPPYEGATWYRGKNSSPMWMPWFSDWTTGQVLELYAKRNPDKQVVVLCGHTHGSGTYRHLDNLVVYTGRAQYGAPDPCGFLDTEDFVVTIT